jgi:nitrogen regulatory protein PII
MQTIQRLELITNAHELAKVLSALDQIGIVGYTVIRNVIGKGTHGQASDDLEATTLSNVYVLVLCTEAQVANITAAVTPILQRYGGICWVSNATQIFPG